jgi:opacity protein-like surface antigen
MKKMLLVAAATAALSTSLATTALADVENEFYAKFNVGATKMNDEKDSDTGLKMKSKVAPIFIIGGGYNIYENFRGDLTIEHASNLEMKKTGVSTKFNNDGFTGNTTIKHKGTASAMIFTLYGDVDVSAFKLFAGAGVGVSQVKTKITGKATIAEIPAANNVPLVPAKDVTSSVSTKSKTNAAFKVTVGASTQIADGVDMELAYAYTNYGKDKGKSAQTFSRDVKVNTGTTRYAGHSVTAGIRIGF